MNALFKKLNLGTIDKILVLNSPDSFEAELESLDGVKVLKKTPKSGAVAFGLAFAITKAQLDQACKELIRVASEDMILWVAYPKGSSKKYKCEFNRDSGWEVLGEAGFEGVRQVAIDADWSALRFRRVEHIKSMTRSGKMAISAAGKKRTAASDKQASDSD